MARSWSDAARAVLEAYPWTSAGDRAKAVEEAELVSFGDHVEVDDLPLALRQWQRRQRSQASLTRPLWKGESWREATEGFEKAILIQALQANNGNLAATARALRTTRRVVAYKSRKYGLA